MSLITGLIDKQDTFEIVRDQITAILAVETAAQVALAIAGGEDPDLWGLQVFEERSNPWEVYQDDSGSKLPIVNIWYEGSNFDESGSNIMERQKATGTFNIDCYGYGVSADDGGAGHLPGDRVAALAVQRALRLVRNILMSAPYTYLALRGTVWQRWPQSVTVFQPEIDTRSVHRIVGARMAFRVKFSEFAPQIDETTLELISVDVIRTEDGQVVVGADYDYTAGP